MKRSKPDWYGRLASGPFAGPTFTQRHADGALQRVRQAETGRRPGKRWAAWATATAAVVAIGAVLVLRQTAWLPPKAATEPPGQAVVSPDPTAVATPTPIRYIDEATALSIAKQHNADPNVKWTARFDAAMELGDKKQTFSVWVAEGVYPAGNKDIFYIDAATGQVLANSEIEAPIAEDRFTEALAGFADGDTAWMLTAADVWRTTKAGSSWSIVTPQNYAAAKSNRADLLPKAAFIDKDSAVVAMPQDGKPAVSVYRTADGGKSWRQSELQSSFDTGRSPYVVQLAFTDRDHGWMLLSWGFAAGSNPVEIFRTVDGGATWQLAAGNNQTNQPGTNGIPFGGGKSGIAFADAQHGYVAGYSAAPGVWFYATADGGTNWKAQKIALPSGLSDEAVFTEAPQFVSAKDGFLAVRGNWGKNNVLFYVTHDAGLTWSATTPLALTPGETPRYSFIDVNHGFVTDGDALYATQNGGKTWSAVPYMKDDAHYPNALKGDLSLQFVDQQNGYAVAGGNVYVTKDGGRTWQGSYNSNKKNQ